jgi:hypothetical protein
MPEEATTTTIQREAPFLEDYRRRLAESTFARTDVAQVPPAIQVSPLEAEVAQGRQLIQTGLGAYQPYLTTGAAQLGAAQTGLAGAAAPLTAAQAGITGAAAPTLAAAAPYITGAQAPITAAQTMAQQAAIAPTQAGIAQYMSPYQADVTQSALAEMQRQADMARNRMAAEAVGAGAYGGARMGVQGAELERNLADVQSQRIFQDLQQNYQQALGAYQTQQQAGLGAATGLGQLGLAQAGLGTALGQIGGTQASAYGQLGNLAAEQARQAGIQAQIGGQQAALAPAVQQLGQADIAPLFNIGNVYQQQAQRELEAQRQTALERQGEPYQRLGFLSDILSKVPSAYSTYGVTTAPSPSPISQALGAGLVGLGAYSAYKNPTYGLGALNLMGTGANMGGFNPF